MERNWYDAIWQRHIQFTANWTTLGGDSRRHDLLVNRGGIHVFKTLESYPFSNLGNSLPCVICPSWISHKPAPVPRSVGGHLSCTYRMVCGLGVRRFRKYMACKCWQEDNTVWYYRQHLAIRILYWQFCRLCMWLLWRRIGQDIFWISCWCTHSVNPRLWSLVCTRRFRSSGYCH